MPVLTMCGGKQRSSDRDAVISSVDYVTYIQVTGMSADADVLIIISWTSIDHQIVIEFL